MRSWVAVSALSLALVASASTATATAAAAATAFAPATPVPFRRLPPTEAASAAAAATVRRMGNTIDGVDIDGDFAPVNDMILVKKAEVIDETSGGIILTGKQKIRKSEGVVVSAGPGRTNHETGFQSPMPVVPGEAVIFGKYDGTEVKLNGADHTLIRDDDVLVKFPSADSSLDLDGAEVLWDSVLVRVPEVEEDTTSSGILLAKTTAKKKTSSVGEVVKVGPGRHAFNGEMMEMDVVPGDMIKFRDFAAQEVEIGEEEFAVVRMTDVLAKF